MRKRKSRLLLGILLIGILFMIGLVWYLVPQVSSFSLEKQENRMQKAKEYGDKIVGWLRVEGTNIDMPLIEATRSTDVEKRDYDFAWTYSHPDKNSNHPSFISHNIRNVSNQPVVGDDTMSRFEQLMSFIYLDFMKKNQFIEYTNESGVTSLYRIYAVGMLKDDQTRAYLDTYTLEEEKSYIKEVKKDSMYHIATKVDETDPLLTLYTCTRFYGATDSYSFRVDARRLREGEAATLAKVGTNKNYRKIKNKMKEGKKNEDV